MFDIFSMFRHIAAENHLCVLREATTAYQEYLKGTGKRRVTFFKSNNIKITFDCKKRLVSLKRIRANREYSFKISREDLLDV
jgi:hypothetical protein